MSRLVSGYFSDVATVWNRFWFVPKAPHTLAVMRILVGSMLLYMHFVWGLGLSIFFSDAGMLPQQYRFGIPEITIASWSHFDWLGSSEYAWVIHIGALGVFACFMTGFQTRLAGWLSAAFAISYANRAIGALFGLDQIVIFLTLYLSLSRCGDAYSIDRWLAGRKQQGRAVRETTMNNVATRLIQVHMCIVYLFAGLGKLQGDSWWNGEAIWGALASYEYQTMDMTWLADYMGLVNLITYAAVAWEVSYCFLIWPRLSRPIVLLFAVFVHLGIGCAMGMMTFGLIMIYGNLAFVSPSFLGAVSSDQTIDGD